MTHQLRRKLADMAALIALVLAMLPAATMAPQSARAEGRALDLPDEAAVPSADASKEIVYIANDGVIWVLDTQFSGKQVQWRSPTNDWRSIALGDFDNDGDKEIAAVRGTPGSATAPELAVFDPVVAKGSIVPGQEINGIPWKTMYNTPLPTRPELVFAGNFDPNVPGDEIGIVRALAAGEGDPGDITRVVIYKQTSLNPDGTSWTIHQIRDFGDKWERVAVGNLDRQGGDEVAFVDTDKGTFAVYQPDADFRKLIDEGSQTKPWKDVAFAQYFRGGNLELLAVRDAEPPLNAFVAWQYKDGKFDGDKGDKFNPGPRIVFAGDINGSNDDQEAFMIRNCSDAESCKRLFVRGDGDDKVISEFTDGLSLDGKDKFYREGAAGDIDGDGRDEFAIISEDRIRVFPDAHINANFIDFKQPTNRRSILIGDLDRNGFISGPLFGASISQVNTTAYFGFKHTGSFTLKNVSTNDPIPFVATTNATWLSVTPTAGTAPGANAGSMTIGYEINATNLQPSQTYTGTITFTNTNGGLNVPNSPYQIPVVVKVELPPFGATPGNAYFVYYPCAEPLDTRTADFLISGVPSNTFSARVITLAAAANAAGLEGDIFLGQVTDGGIVLTDRTGAQGLVTATTAPAITASTNVTWTSEAPWISSVTSLTNTLPTTLTLTVSPTLRSDNYEQAKLLLTTVDPVKPNQLLTKLHDINLLCAESASWLPVVGNTGQVPTQ
ncbi:MAG: BACON domain-containing protein [Caldilineaceae bacterium]|nr:BACON domain-containing protein [Caldilineaceae bacterium]